MQFPVTQGFIPSFTSAEIDVGGRRVFGIKRIAWNESCEGEVEYGNGVLPLGETAGQYSADAEVEQLLGEYVELITRLGNGFRSKAFNIGVQFNEVGSNLISVEIKTARILAPAVDATGKAGTVVKYKLRVFEPIRINGLSMIDRFNSGQSGGFSIGGAVQAVGNVLSSFGAGISG